MALATNFVMRVLVLCLMIQQNSSCCQMESKYALEMQLNVSTEGYTLSFFFCLWRDVHYIDRDGAENYYTEESFPSNLEKKMKLLTYFRRYMNEHLVKAGGSIAPRECDLLSRIPYLHTWFRTPSAVVMHLTNGTLQVRKELQDSHVLFPFRALKGLLIFSF